MTAINIVKKTGPATYIPLATKTIAGGQLVVPSGAAGRIDVAGANSAVVLGVAVTDGMAPDDVTTAPVNGVLNAAQLAPYVTVAYGVEVDGVTYAANALFGQKLKSAANGAVTPFVSGTDVDPALVIGVCSQPGGVLANATGLVRLK